MNPYVGDGVYTYRIDLPLQKQSVGVRISAVGGGAKFRSSFREQFVNELEILIQPYKTQYLFNVLWTKEGSGVQLMVRPNNSTIKLNADLCNINVQMKAMEINALSTFDLGSNITLWCSYPLNKNAIIEWTYDKKKLGRFRRVLLLRKANFK